MYQLAVVVCTCKKPKKYETYYVKLNTDQVTAQEFQSLVAKKGFKAEDHRYFPDEIESLVLKEVEDEVDRTESSEHKETDCPR